MSHPLLVILPDIRSAHNVGAIMRTADAVGAHVWTCGFTPYPHASGDDRPPHVADRARHLIAKTALGAENTVYHRHFERLDEAIAAARHNHYRITALEQAEGARNLLSYHSEGATALVVGPEVTGLSPADLALCDLILELPMQGTKESLNVAVAAGIALYHLRFTT